MIQRDESVQKETMNKHRALECLRPDDVYSVVLR
jgi:hypothetical protein